MMARDPMAEIEKDLFGEATEAQRARQLLTKNAVMAASQLVDLAQNGQSERTRLTASQEILNRVLGPIGKDDQSDSLSEFLEGITKLATKASLVDNVTYDYEGNS
jgi:hypothetical protein